MYPIDRPTKLRKEEASIREKLAKVRQADKPKRKTARVLKTAKKIESVDGIDSSPGSVEKSQGCRHD